MKALVSFTDKEKVDWVKITQRVDEDIKKDTLAFMRAYNQKDERRSE